MPNRPRYRFVLLAAAVLGPLAATASAESDRPNVLWLVAEDMSATLGCYGDEYATTPNIDKLAEDGIRYDNAFATSGVCAPARSCLITGVYPSSIGSHHMRSRGERPDWMHMFPKYLRQKAGYFTTNNAKTDYNLPVEKGTWDQNSHQAHYKNRPDEGTPFFSVFNYGGTHESQQFGDPKNLTHDPAEAPVPPYHPDQQKVREDWADYYDDVTGFDEWVGKHLDRLEEKGLADETIVFVYGDHGVGLARGKRWLWDSGLRVPLVVRVPEKYQHLAGGLEPGSSTDRLVSFVDFGATVMSLAGVETPDHMHGKAFLGEHEAEPRDYIYGIRGRMDERIDMQRAVRDKRFKYIRNYMPQKTYALHLNYMYREEVMQVWDRWFHTGRTNAAQSFFFTDRRPVEELYDTKKDPHEVNNLADDPEYQDELKRLRKEHFEWVMRTRDVGFLPEAEIDRRPKRLGYEHAWAMARADEADAYPLQRIHAAAVTASKGQAHRDEMVELLDADDPAVRFWGALGLNNLGDRARPAADALIAALEDEDPSVATEAASALCKIGYFDTALPVIAEHALSDDQKVALRAVIVADRLDEQATPIAEKLREARKKQGGYPERVLNYMFETEKKIGQ